MKSQSVKIGSGAGKVSGILQVPRKVIAGLTLAHGAGAGMKHPFMSELAEVLTERGFAVLRFQFPYMEAGRKRVDSPDTATATIAAAVAKLRTRLPADLPVFAGGKSFGARMSTNAAARGLLPEIAGLICYGFPLHPAGEPAVKRAEHLADVTAPILFLQGTRDDLADLKLMKKVCAKLPRATLGIIDGADHGFGVLKRSGRTHDDVLGELAEASRAFVLDGPV